MIPAFAPVPGLKVVFDGKWNTRFALKDFKVEHVTELSRLLCTLDKAFYASDYQTEFAVDIDHTITFNLYTDNAEIAEYVNRIFVAAQ